MKIAHRTSTTVIRFYAAGEELLFERYLDLRSGAMGRSRMPSERQNVIDSLGFG